MIPVLVPLSLAGTIAVPITPVVVALVSVALARVGVATYCKLDDDEDKLD